MTFFCMYLCAFFFLHHPLLLFLFKPHLLIHVDFLWTIFKNLLWLSFSIWKCMGIGNTDFSTEVWVQINYIKFVVYFEGEWLSAKLWCLFRLNKCIYPVCTYKFKEDTLFSQDFFKYLSTTCAILKIGIFQTNPNSNFSFPRS